MEIETKSSAVVDCSLQLEIRTAALKEPMNRCEEIDPGVVHARSRPTGVGWDEDWTESCHRQRPLRRSPSDNCRQRQVHVHLTLTRDVEYKQGSVSISVVILPNIDGMDANPSGFMRMSGFVSTGIINK
ncbi:hypothetical protein Mapa_016894 [Marchantia paleacea]|nr:hypothetical protein Mapa_016894 [Marchantia paleacea]